MTVRNFIGRTAHTSTDNLDPSKTETAVQIWSKHVSFKKFPYCQSNFVSTIIILDIIFINAPTKIL